VKGNLAGLVRLYEIHQSAVPLEFHGLENALHDLPGNKKGDRSAISSNAPYAQFLGLPHGFRDGRSQFGNRQISRFHRENANLAAAGCQRPFRSALDGSPIPNADAAGVVGIWQVVRRADAVLDRLPAANLGLSFAARILRLPDSALNFLNHAVDERSI
jgi:hypothetical protein